MPEARLQIMVPFWGDPGLLRQTVASLRAQPGDRWSAVVVDDHYPDPEVERWFAELDDPRISYVRNEANLGIVGNFQRCKDLADAELVTFLGCDDLVDPAYAETILRLHERFPDAALLQPGVRVVDGAGRQVDPLADRVKDVLRPRAAQPRELSGEALATGLLHGDWLYWPSLAFRREAIAGLDFRPDLSIILDLDLIMRLVLAGESLALTDEVCFSYRRHDSSLSSTARVDGPRFADEARWYAECAARLHRLGWRRAELAARLRATSRLHAASLLPGVLRARRPDAARTLLRHALGGRTALRRR